MIGKSFVRKEPELFRLLLTSFIDISHELDTVFLLWGRTIGADFDTIFRGFVVDSGNISHISDYCLVYVGKMLLLCGVFKNLCLTTFLSLLL